MVKPVEIFISNVENEHQINRAHFGRIQGDDYEPSSFVSVERLSWR